MKKIKLIRQPKGSFNCGPCCVAMLAGTTMEEAIKAIDKSGLTCAPHLRRGLNALGIQCGDKLVKGWPEKDETAIVKLLFIDFEKDLGKKQAKKLGLDGPRRGHWVVWHKNKFYDPDAGVFKNLPDYLSMCNYISHLKVTL